jgi:hypothetical protein
LAGARGDTCVPVYRSRNARQGITTRRAQGRSPRVAGAAIDPGGICEKLLVFPVRQLRPARRRDAITIAHQTTRDPRSVGDVLRADIHRITDTRAVVLPIVRVCCGRDECECREDKYSHRAHSHDPFLIIQSFFATLGRERPLFAPSENHKHVKKFRIQLIQVADLIGNFRLKRRMMPGAFAQTPLSRRCARSLACVVPPGADWRLSDKR